MELTVTYVDTTDGTDLVVDFAQHERADELELWIRTHPASWWALRGYGTKVTYPADNGRVVISIASSTPVLPEDSREEMLQSLYYACEVFFSDAQHPAFT